MDASLAEGATAALVGHLSQQKNFFRSVQDLQGSSFVAQNGLLFAPTDKLAPQLSILSTVQHLVSAQRLVQVLASDPRLRGCIRALQFGLLGVQAVQFKLDDMLWPMTLAANTLDQVKANQPASFSWRVLVQGHEARPADLLRFVTAVLDYSELEPGLKASNAVRQAAADLNLALTYQARVRLTVNYLDALEPTLAQADQVAAKLRTLPQVGRVVTLSTFIPEEQGQILPLIQNAAKTLNTALYPKELSKPTTDAENVTMMNSTVDALGKLAADSKGPGADTAKRLAADLTSLVQADPATRQRAEAAFVQPLQTALNDLRNLLKAREVTRDNLPPELVSQWMTPDGKARIVVLPSGNTDDDATLQTFAQAVLGVEPNATEGRMLSKKSANERSAGRNGE